MTARSSANNETFKAPGEPFFDSTQEVPGRWDNLDFTFSEKTIFGDTLPTNPGARLRTVARSIHDVAPMAEVELQGQLATEALAQTKKFLDTTVHIRKIPYKRRDFCDPDDMCAAIWVDTLEPTNDPISQSWAAVQQLNQARQEHNLSATATHKKKVLRESELDELARDLVFSLKNQTLRTRYESIIQKHKHPTQPDA